MERTEIVSLYKNTPADGTVVTVCGWAKNIRDSKNIGFIALSDGGCFKTLQVVLEAGKLANYDEVIHTGLYSSLRVKGKLVLTPQAKQPFELNADSVEILGDCPADEYPLQKKKMSMEYLRTMPTLRPRTNTFNAAFRVRSAAAYAIHKFFQENGFVYSHSPLLTSSDCEGAGEMFRVTTLDLENVPKNEDGTVDYTQDFFEKPVNLTVSGQLEAEAMAMAFGKVYTFGPTFRAEKSFTTRHAAEFWMIEPEMAFCDLSGYMDTAEAMTKYVIRYVLDNCPDEMAFFNQFIDKGLIESGAGGKLRVWPHQLHRGHRDPEEEQQEVPVPCGVGRGHPDRARALPDRGGVQEACVRHRLPEGDQELLHEAEPGRQDRGSRRYAGARHRRADRRQPA